MAEQYGDYYRRIASQFSKIRLDREAEILATCEIIQRFLKPQDGTILDVGCGTGRYASCMHEQGYSIVGIDLSIAQLKYAVVNIPLLCANAVQLPFPSDHFVAGTMIMMIHQLSDLRRQQAFAEMARVLVSHGTFVIKTCSHADLEKRPFNQYFPSSLIVNRKRYPDIPDLTARLTQIGFKITDIVSTSTEEEIKTEDLLNSVRSKHNTTLSLISPLEFQQGYQTLIDEFSNNEMMTIPHHHTLIILNNEKGGKQK